MPLRRMPNGAFVDVPDDITPEGMAKIATSFKATASTPSGGVTVSVGDDASEDDKQIEAMKARRGREGAHDALQDNLTHSMTLGLDDVVGGGLEAATEGVYRAVKNKDIGEVGRTYTNSRTASQQLRDAAREEHPVASTLGGGVGMVASPMGASTGLRALATRVAPKMVEKAVASKAGKVIGKLGGSSIGLGARAGANQGFVTGLVDDGNIEDAGNEALIGGVFGGVGGGVLKAGKTVGRTIADRLPENAKRVAYSKIAQMLERSENSDTPGKPWTPKSVLNEIKATDKGGGDAVVADLTPEGQAWASHLAKQGTTASNRLVNDSADRMAGAPDRFNARVRQQLGITKNTPDAYDSVKGIKQARKQAGAEMYTDDVMDKQLVWNDKLDDYMTRPTVLKALPRARDKVLDDGKDPTALAFDDVEGGMRSVPSMRSIQHVIGTLDDDIGEAVRAGRMTDAKRLSGMSRSIKDEIASLNPEFAQANAMQRDMFQQQESVELGAKVLDHLRTGKAREVLDMVRDPKIKPDDLKTGFADALLHLREKGTGDPVKALRRMMRSDDQRKVLARMFGSNRALNEFERFMRREVRSMDTDAAVSAGRALPKDLLKEPGDGGAGAAAMDLAKSVGTGMAFGGPLGAAARGTRSVGMWDKTISRHAKEQLADVLGGKGEGLQKGVQRSAAYKRILARRDARAAVLAGKAPGTVVTGYSEQ